MKVFREDGGELLRLYDRKGGKIRQRITWKLYILFVCKYV